LLDAPTAAWYSNLAWSDDGRSVVVSGTDLPLDVPDPAERTLREVHLPPFVAAVEAGVVAVMPAFTDLAGIPMTANRSLLRECLRDQLGFNGVLVSDYNAIGELLRHGVAGDLAEAAALAIRAGVDIDMMSDAYRRGLPLALSRGLADIEDIDESVWRVLRLKGGDPFVFGRGGEEIEALRRAGVAYSVVPGITAGLGAAAQFEVPLTFRHEALRITFLTAHKARDAEAVDWSTLTDEKMTIVVYMGMTAAPSVRAGLLAAGRSPHTPVGVFARVTRPDAEAAVGTLDELPDLVEKIDGGPAILIIGDVVAHSAPWRHPNLDHVITQLLEAAE